MTIKIGWGRGAAVPMNEYNSLTCPKCDSALQEYVGHFNSTLWGMTLYFRCFRCKYEWGIGFVDGRPDVSTLVERYERYERYEREATDTVVPFGR